MDFDRWITSGRYSEHLVVVTCKYCGEATNVKVTTEYGASEWNPEECKHCKEWFDGDESWFLDEPDPEPDEYEE